MGGAVTLGTVMTKCCRTSLMEQARSWWGTMREERVELAPPFECPHSMCQVQAAWPRHTPRTEDGFVLLGGCWGVERQPSHTHNKR